MSAVEDRLAELGLTVPDVAKPVAADLAATGSGRLPCSHSLARPPSVPVGKSRI